MAAKTLNIPVGDKTISIEVGKIAKQADGSAVVRLGETMVLVTACAAPEQREGIDFFPLTVDYQEKLFAAGRIPGSFFRREGRPTEKEVLTCRIIDRSCRPLFPEGFRNETQVIANVYSMDRENEPEALALTAASIALTLSDIPFAGPIAGIRVGRVDGKLIANPTIADREKSDVDIMMAASKDAIVMVEGGAKELAEKDMVEALFFGFTSVQPLIRAQEALKAEMGREKRKFETVVDDEKLKEDIKNVVYDRLKKAFGESDKGRRYGALREAKQAVLDVMKEKPWFEERVGEIKRYVEDLKYTYMRSMIVDQKVRIGGRKDNEIRQITSEVAVLPRAHGSALFTRGETQALVATTLGTSEDEQRIELLTGQIYKKFMLHYNFPPFSVGEVKRVGSPGRREVGHGALAERALRQVMPSEESFPYTVRIVSEILESNGSSSMASVCGGCLSLMDAGVPITAPVAGIAMGLIKEGDKIAILSDILGDEDHLGDMDFKVCGTAKGITAIQMDIKISGVTKEILERALEQARQGRVHILAKMAEALATPRTDLNKYAPRIVTIRIPTERIKDVIGPGGKVIRDIVARTGTKIDIEDDGSVNVASADGKSLDAAIKMIKDLTQEAEIGRNYMGTVRKITDFGAFVEIFPGTDGLLHISEISDKRIKQVSDVLKEGEEVLVKVLSVDKQGKIRLSRKEALAAKTEPAAAPKPN